MLEYLVENIHSATACRPVYNHIPVLVDEVLTFVHPHAGGIYVDATLGEGGHSAALLRASAPSGRLIGIDRDAEVLAVAQSRLAVFGPRVQLVHGHASEMRAYLDAFHVPSVDAVLLDLGMSSYQIENPTRGFSFVREGPLDMRMDRTIEPTAETLVNTLAEADLVTLIQRNSEERWARRIARAIVRARRRSAIRTTQDLAALVTQAIPPSARPPRIHPATRTFQALRIAVNQELATLEEALKTAVACLRVGGRVCVIAYHSLEDRIVKQTFRTAETLSSNAEIRVQVVTHKPIIASALERQTNPRARSAKLRVIERT